MAKKKMDREELAEFKNGKYMGGPAEERAEKKKKKSKRYADGGMVEFGPDPGGNTGIVPQDMLRRKGPMGQHPERRLFSRRDMMRNRPGDIRPPGRPMDIHPMRSDDEGMLPPIPAGGIGRPGGMGDMIPAGYNPNKGYERPGMKNPMSPDKGFERPGMKRPGKMRGGGLARKGVGQALAKGGLVKGAGCTSRGVKKAKMY